MTARSIVDPTRQAGEDIAPKREGGAPPVSTPEGTAYFDGQRWRQVPASVNDALAYAEKQLWRQVRTRSHQALLTLAGEIGRLRIESAANEAACNDCADGLNDAVAEILRLRAVNSNDRALNAAVSEILRLRAAIPEIVGCAYGEGLACRRDTDGRHGCCLARLRALRLGITAAGWVEAGEDVAARYPATMARIAEEDDCA